jgi:hypothetical protein
VNGEALDAITLKTGQACTVEVVSDNSNPYSAYVGFDDRVVLGSFDQPLATPEAGDLASITEYDVPSFYGYYVSAAGTSPPPSPGVHFIIEYEPQQVGETELKLYDPLRMTVIATVHITVVDAEMGTVFTYQGRLMEAGNPADGQYDFEFILYNAPSYGTQLAGTVEVNDLDVIDGYFTVELDFGSDVFDGDARWLEVGVRPGVLTDPNLYVTLPERQPVTACPYALQTRGIFVDSRLNVGIGTTSPKGKLHVDGGMAAWGTNGTNIVIEAQQGGVGNPDGYDGGNIILLPGEGGYGSMGGTRGEKGNVGIGTAGPEAMLDVRGNIKVDQKIQAHDSGGLELATDEGTTRIFIGDDGKVGIGTTSPSAKLEVAGDVTVKKIGEDVDISLVSGTGSSSKLLFGNRFEPGAAAIKFDNLTQVLSFKNWLTDDALVITQDGKVGIGTTSPISRLEVMATENQHGIRSTVPRIAVYGHRTGTSGTWPGVHGECDSLSSNASGVRGVITSTSPGSNSAGVRGINNGTGATGVGVYGWQAGSGYGVYGDTAGNGYGVCGYNSSSGNYGYLGGSGSSYGVYGSSNSGYGVCGYNSSSGNYGYLGGSGYAGAFTGNVYVTGNVSADSFTDRTPYPKDLATAYQAVMSMERLGDGQYDENNKQVQLDHSKLSDFIKSKDGNRDLSATVSAINEVVKDLIRKVEAQQQLIEIQNAQIQQMVKTLQTNKQQPQIGITKGAVQ